MFNTLLGTAIHHTLMTFDLGSARLLQTYSITKPWIDASDYYIYFT